MDRLIVLAAAKGQDADELEDQLEAERTDAICSVVEESFIAPLIGRYSREELQEIVGRLMEVVHQLGSPEGEELEGVTIDELFSAVSDFDRSEV